jgi:hypothetical protein
MYVCIQCIQIQLLLCTFPPSPLSSPLPPFSLLKHYRLALPAAKWLAFTWVMESWHLGHILAPLFGPELRDFLFTIVHSVI